MNVETLKERLLTVLDERKAEQIVCLDVHALTSITDWMIIATGTSSRHTKAVAEYLVQEAKNLGHQPTGVEGLQSGEWVLVDLDRIIVHIMLAETRRLYDLERQWRQTPLMPAQD